MLEFSIISISTFVTVLNEVVKYLGEKVLKKDVKRYIPIFSIIFGIILGIAGFYIPGVEMGKNIVEAIFIGIAAGSAATGVNQITKQLYKNPIPEVIPTVDIASLIGAIDLDEEKTEEEKTTEDNMKEYLSSDE